MTKWSISGDLQSIHRLTMLSTKTFIGDIHQNICLSVYPFEFFSIPQLTTIDLSKHWVSSEKTTFINTVLPINNRFQMLNPAQCPLVVTLTDSPQMCNSVTQSHILSYCFSRLLSLLPNSHRNYAQTVARWRLYRLSNSTLTHDPWSLKIRSGIKIHESLLPPSQLRRRSTLTSC